MTPDTLEKVTSPLHESIDRLIALQDGLHAAIRAKLEAMRRLDTRAMGEAARQEAALAAEAGRLDAVRRQQVGALCEVLGIPRPSSVDHITLSLLCRHLPADLARDLWQRGQTLRERMLSVAEANRVVELVTREMMLHFKTLFAAFVADDEAQWVYSRAGAIEAVGSTAVLDAVG